MDRLRDYIAIDFGTTNSLAYIYKNSGADCVPNMLQQGKYCFPSFVDYYKDHIQTGFDAKRYFGEKGHFVIAAVKRILGLDFQQYEEINDKSIFGCQIVEGDDGLPYFVVDEEGRQVSPIVVASYIFKEIKEAAEVYGGREYQYAYVTVPANYGDHQCKAIKKAAQLAGLEVEKLITEPTAAALSWCFDHLNDIQPKERMVVYDFGGGTFDVSLVEYQEDGTFLIVDVDGNPCMGGNDIDRSLMDVLMEEYKKQYHSTKAESVIEKKKSKRNKYRSECENIKILITNICHHYDDEESFIKNNLKRCQPFDFSFLDRNAGDVSCTPLIIQNASRFIIENSVDITVQLLDRNHFTPNDISRFFLVGGSSNLHLSKQLIHKTFTKVEFPDIEPDKAVAMGAMKMIINDILYPNRPLVKEKIVISYGLQTSYDSVALILKKGMIIPAESAPAKFKNTEGYEETFRSDLYQWYGTPEDKEGVVIVPITECTRIGCLEFANPYPQPPLQQKLSIVFRLGVGGTLEVECTDKRRNEILASKTYDAVHG